MHQLDESIEEIKENVDVENLDSRNNHGIFIHEFLFTKYLKWLQNLINQKIKHVFDFVKENRESINDIDNEHHELRTEFDNLKADYNSYKTTTNAKIASLESANTTLQSLINSIQNSLGDLSSDLEARVSALENRANSEHDIVNELKDKK